MLTLTRPSIIRDCYYYQSTQNHTFTYDEPIKVESVTEAVGDLAMRFGESTADEDALMVRDERDWSSHVKPARLTYIVAFICTHSLDPSE